VDFPLSLDIQPYVTPALSKAISAKRSKLMDEEAAKLGLSM